MECKINLNNFLNNTLNFNRDNNYPNNFHNNKVNNIKIQDFKDNSIIPNNKHNNSLNNTLKSKVNKFPNNLINNKDNNFKIQVMDIKEINLSSFLNNTHKFNKDNNFLSNKFINSQYNNFQIKVIKDMVNKDLYLLNNINKELFINMETIKYLIYRLILIAKNVMEQDLKKKKVIKNLAVDVMNMPENVRNVMEPVGI